MQPACGARSCKSQNLRRPYRSAS
jgi:hypothetical protein